MKRILFVVISILMFSALYSEDRLPNVMVTGYWDPTGSMVSQFSTDPSLNPSGWNGANWNNLGYDIYSFFPPPNVRDFEVDYQDTWEDFWAVADTLHPVAIISFGAGAGPWEIEHLATNNDYWVPDDIAPYQPTPSPPDDTVPVGTNRYSTLPMEKMMEAVNSLTTINAWIDWDGDMGNYLCEFMAYLGMWYQDQHSSPDDPHRCYAAGFTHVNAGLPLADCVQAAEITIQAVLENINLQVTGSVVCPGIDLSGTTVVLEGNTSMTTTLDSTGLFSFNGLTTGTYTVTAYRDRMHFTSEVVTIDSDNTNIDLSLIEMDNHYEFSVCTDPHEIHSLNTANPCNVALRVLPEDIPETDIKIFTDISFYAPTTTDSCDITMFVYEYTTGQMLPGSIIYEQDVEVLQADTWFTHNLEVPILINSDAEYFLGYRVTNNETGKIVWKDQGPQVFNNGTWACFGSQWMNLSYMQANWMIKAGYMTPEPLSIADAHVVPKELRLKNYPNPFNPSTTISFNVVDETSPVYMSIYDIKGRRVANLIDGKRLKAGPSAIDWAGEDRKNSTMPSGIYFVRVRNGSFSEAYKMVLLK